MSKSETQQLGARIPADQYRAIRVAAAKRGITIADLVREMITDFLKDGAINDE